MIEVEAAMITDALGAQRRALVKLVHGRVKTERDKLRVSVGREHPVDVRGAVGECVVEKDGGVHGLMVAGAHLCPIYTILHPPSIAVTPKE